jgi:hypothetical protein
MTTKKTAAPKKKTSAKSKNPLYVVKGKDVEAATGLFDLLVKKLNLAPVIQMIQTLMNELLKSVQTYSMFEAVKKIIDDLMAKVTGLVQRFGLA